MHGAGLTHVFFLPDWATLFESYHCKDPGCYGDLARLRGVNYVTWEDDNLLVADELPDSQHKGHPKFKNYSLDKDEFLRIVDQAAEKVKSHEKFRKLDINRSQKKEEL
jgi:protein O-GlcNAc transferase